MALIICKMSSRCICWQLTGTTLVWYCFSRESFSCLVSSLYGRIEFNTTTYGFPISSSFVIVVFSASVYASRSSSPIEPSVTTTIPMVAWSRITFSVPMRAASTNGISSSIHGVLTIRFSSPSICPLAPCTINPTQSISRTLISLWSASIMLAASCGMNFGSVVIIVLPAADCGSSSSARLLAFSSSIFGNTNKSINRLINVDFPVRTGPTTPI